MGNKPKAQFEKKSFTGRVLGHPSIAYYPYPPKAPCAALVAFVHDQLLIGQQVLGNKDLRAELEGRCDRVASVFDDDAPGENVEIWQLRKVTGKKRFPDVAHFAWMFRAQLLAKHGVAPEQVAPNHVLIPAGNYHGCPWGPPEPPRVPPPEIERSEPTVRVAVIDSGWATNGDAPALVEQPVTFGDWLGPGGWTPGVEDPFPPVTAGTGPQRLDALAAHANFIAGVIAQASPSARIHVESLSARFVDSDTTLAGIPTEAAVARALWRQRDHDVIHVGFAFPTLPNIPLTREDAGLGGPPSWALQVVLDALGKQGEHAPFVVSPAGNQNCTVPQYPAAFWPTHDNVVGVGSIRNATNRSAFSNHGPWVRCCTEGEDVVSTFIYFDGETEEAEPGPGNFHPFKDFDGWASWDGTSFSSPKVTGALAEGKATGLSVAQAWNNLVGGTPQGLDMGHILDGLRPL